MTDSDTPSLSRGKKLVFLLVLLVMCLGAVELGWRLYSAGKLAEALEEQDDSFWMEHPTLGQVYKPGEWSIEVENEEPVRFSINALHMRGGPVLDPKPDDVLRILCLGGSTTFGTGCKADSSAYPALLETMLAARYPGQRFEVLNAGTPGYRSAESLMNLERLADLEPDIVIVYHGINDICWGVPTPFFLDPQNHPRPLSRLDRKRREASSFFFQALVYRVTDPRPKNPDDRQSLDPAMLDAFAANLERIYARARALGAVPVSATFGARLAADMTPEVRAEIEQERAFELAHLPFDALVDAMAAINQRHREVAAKEGVLCVDLEGAFPHDPALWMDFVHLNDAGTPLMAERIADALGPALEEARAD